ncbi:type IV secretory system conjugative DNA transfer family protein [Ponticaulis koreensis]|uniref:type IV secretory system conjugative DNA transfer family protein n=1 Tax=Ponticaulis koreensis TaxID=1123045 RepID=UPI0003B405B4|nr:type IV secretory system conjugative DNA transfer family protein [Ponticaulis koreensis]
MSKAPENRNLILQGTTLTVITGIGWYYRHLIYIPDFQIPACIAAFTLAAGWLDWSGAVLRVIPRLFKHWRVRKPKGEKGTARWANAGDATKAGLFKRSRRKTGYYVGLAFGEPVFVDIESNGLVLSPAGGGKTTGFVIPALMHHTGSIFVSDMKQGSLVHITSRTRKKRLKNEIVILDPVAVMTGIDQIASRYNPLSLLIDDWKDDTKRKYLMSDLRGFVKQMLPEPKQEGENKFFRSGSRKLLQFALLYLIMRGEDASLTKALLLLSDMGALESALYIAQNSDALNGELKRLADDLLGKLTDSDRKQFESFREGALQVLEPYGPGSLLAEATSHTDFRFSEMKERNITVYVVSDPTQRDALSEWMGMISWCATTELIRAPGKKPVTFLLDEVTNFKIEGLPGLLTIGREFGIRIWCIVQELEQWSLIYGKEALDTLLSQSEAQVVHGISSVKTAELFSKRMGQTSIRVKTHSIGRHAKDQVTRTLSEQARALMTPDELLCAEDGLLFLRGKPAFRLHIAGYHEIEPWRSRADANPLYGRKRYKGKVKARL